MDFTEKGTSVSDLGTSVTENIRTVLEKVASATDKIESAADGRRKFASLPQSAAENVENKTFQGPRAAAFAPPNAGITDADFNPSPD